MLVLLVYLFILGYGLWYAINPMPSLKRRFGEDAVPPVSVKTARIVGGAIAAVGLIGAIYTAVSLLKA